MNTKNTESSRLPHDHGTMTDKLLDTLSSTPSSASFEETADCFRGKRRSKS